MSFFTTPFSAGKSSGGASAGGSGGGDQPFDIPKEELMALCMKLNKKMQSLESKCHDLTRQKTKLLEERQFLADAISQISHVNVLVNHDDASEPVLHRETLSKWKVAQIQQIESLEIKLAEMVRELEDAKACAAAAQVSGDLLSFDPPLPASAPAITAPTDAPAAIQPAVSLTPAPPSSSAESVSMTPIRTPASSEQFKAEIEVR